MTTFRRISLSLCLLGPATLLAQSVQTTNKPERVTWFQDLGFGMFIHWHVDGAK